MDEELEILETTKTQSVNRVGVTSIWSDRQLIKSKLPQFANFPAHNFPSAFVEDYERTKNFKCNPQDVFLVGFPRSGTTMMQECLWLLMNNFNFEKSQAASTYSRVQYFDFFTRYTKLTRLPPNYIDDYMKHPRVFKSHVPVQFLPRDIWNVKPKIVHIERDIRDVAVSLYFHRVEMMRDDVGTMEEHFEEILNDKVWWSPYRQHLKNYLEMKKNYENVFFIKYENLVASMEEEIWKLGTFLGVEMSEENVQKLVDHMKFENMKKNKMTNMQEALEKINMENNDNQPTDTFIRKGVSGDYKNYMSAEMIGRFDKWIAEGEAMKSSWE